VVLHAPRDTRAYDGQVTDDTAFSRILVITAHPDDVDFGAAGTIATFTESGAKVTYCIVTDGDAGGFDENFPRAEMGPLRRTEQIAAAKCVGVEDVRFLGYPDGQVEATLALRRDLARVIRQVRPDLVICPNPERDFKFVARSHPDHRAVGQAALDAVYPDARNPFAFPELRHNEGLEAWTVPQVWISGTADPDHYVDVTETFPRKVAALRAHQSQTGHMPDFPDWLRARLADAAERGGLPPGRLAESFRRLNTGS
jgi:LmbE family N-acetylglucosaminyl deacetylase